MLGNHKLVVDAVTGIGDIFQDHADELFLVLGQNRIVPSAIYIIGVGQFDQYLPRIMDLIDNDTVKVIFGNVKEGSETFEYFINKYNIKELVDRDKILLLSGGDIDKKYQAIVCDYFLSAVVNHYGNTKVKDYTAEMYSKKDKPYKFLFLNGRGRPHRHYLLDKFKQSNLLSSSLWTNFEPPFEVRSLPYEYEATEYKNNIVNISTGNITMPTSTTNNVTIKEALFNNTWGDGIVTPNTYIDTYFSVVTETVFNHPYSFRTEKTWKPILIGHPFIIASNQGYYRDLHNLGFQTFGHLIDESFDNIDNNQLRLDRIVAVVNDLCQQDLPAFLAAAEETCKYNQQHAVDLSYKLRQEFPQKFTQFINERFRI